MAPLFVKLTHIRPWFSEELIVALGISERRIAGYLLLRLAGQCLVLRLQCCSGVIGGYKGHAELASVDRWYEWWNWFAVV